MGRYQGNAPENSVDIVFIVQQSQCLAETKLKDLPYMIERSLKDKGQDSLRFALVGFGGQDQLAKPHVFTSGSQIFNDVSKMIPSLDNLKNDGQEGANVFEALQFAARLGFRPGVRKTFVLVMCEDVTNSMNSKAYGDSMTMLTEQDITLHLAANIKVFQRTSQEQNELQNFWFYQRQCTYCIRNGFQSQTTNPGSQNSFDNLDSRIWWFSFRSWAIVY